MGYKIDPSNKTIKMHLDDLRKQLPDLPPINATRITIAEEDNENFAPKVTESETKSKTTVKCVRAKKNNENDDFAKLIMPNKIVKSKLSMVASTIKTLNNDVKKEFQKNIKTLQDDQNIKKIKINLKQNGADETVKRVTKYSNGVVIEEL